MANLVITVIAISLVAVASLMGAYYGGSAYLNSQNAAHAATFVNEAQQLAGDWQNYLGDFLDVPPEADVNILVTKNYVQSWPQWPRAAGGVAPANLIVVSVAGNYYAIADVGVSSGASIATDNNATACNRILKSALGSPPGVITAATANNYTSLVTTSVPGTVTYGCGLVLNNTDATPLPNSGASPSPPTLPPPGGVGVGDYTAYYLLSNS